MKTKFNFSNFIPLLSIPAAIFWPEGGEWYFDYLAWILGVMLFLSFLKLDFFRFYHYLRRPVFLLFFSLGILLLPPLIGGPFLYYFFPEYFIAGVLFLLMPAAIVSPVLAVIYKGEVALATVNSVFSNLLSPFVIIWFLLLF